ncbi:MAG TPA: NPCBM/NEW2 domain-containing protein [Tepidisphaeraceae bacterium]|nr:NPCBM/NEW2 domain-containing protein [Tepidisphaeraceae bacterium]
MRFAICDFKIRLTRACGFAVVLLLAHASAVAQQSWTLTTADFKSQSVNLIAVDDAGAKITRVHGGEQSVIPWPQILQLDRATAAAAGVSPAPPAGADAPKFMLYLANGDRVVGQPAALEGETLAWASPAAGRIDVKLKQVIAIARAADQPPRRDQQRTQDIVILANGDTTGGLISGIDKSGITIDSDGNGVTVPWDAVRTVLLAAVASTNPDAAGAGNERSVRLTLADGSVMSGPTINMNAESVTLGTGDAKREVAASAVVSIEQVNGPVAWLSSLPPVESVQTPFLETVFPARMDRTVRGEPLRFGDRTYARGIGVHAYSRLVWQLPEGNRYKTFRTRYAIDGDKPYANVTVRVKLDDKVVHETPDFVAGKLSDVVQVPLGNAKALTLEVDYGETYDVQDRFNWIEPALLAE